MKCFKRSEKCVPTTQILQALPGGPRWHFISEIRSNRHRILSAPTCPEAPTTPKLASISPGVSLRVYYKHPVCVRPAVRRALSVFNISLKSVFFLRCLPPDGQVSPCGLTQSSDTAPGMTHVHETSGLGRSGKPGPSRPRPATAHDHTTARPPAGGPWRKSQEAPHAPSEPPEPSASLTASESVFSSPGISPRPLAPLVYTPRTIP